MKRIPIKERLILYFVLLGLVSIAIVSLFSILEAKKGIRERAFSQLILLRDLRREQILTFYHTRGQELIALANSEKIREVAARFSSKPFEESAQPILPEHNPLFDLVADPANSGALYLITKEHHAFLLEKNPEGYYFKPDPDFFISENLSSLFKNNTGASYTVSEHLENEKDFQLLVIAPVLSVDGEIKALLKGAV